MLLQAAVQQDVGAVSIGAQQLVREVPRNMDRARPKAYLLGQALTLTSRSSLDTGPAKLGRELQDPPGQAGA